MMKRFLTLLLCCLMISCAALAEEPENTYKPIGSMDGFYGIWSCCASNDDLPYLVLHEDMTYEVYDWWQIDANDANDAPGDALLKRGTFTFDPADSAFTLEGNETVYTAKTAMANEDLATGSGEVYGNPNMQTLLLEARVTLEEDDFYDPSMLFLPEKPEEMRLLPTVEDLCTENLCWMITDDYVDPDSNEPGWLFFSDGTATLQQNDQKDIPATYAYDNGALTITREDGSVQHLLLQHAYIPIPDEDEEPDEKLASLWTYFDLENDENFADSTVLSFSLLRVHDLDANTTYYFYGCY